MKKGLFSKMLITYAIIISFGFVIMASLLSIWFQNYYFDQRKEQLNSQTNLIGNYAVEYLRGEVSEADINAVLRHVGKYINADIFLSDRFGKIYSVSNQKHIKFVGEQILKEDLNDLKEGRVVEKKGAYLNIFNVPMYTYEIPLFTNNTFIGTIMMNTSIEGLKEPLKKVYEIIWMVAIGAIILSCIVIYYFSQKIIITPLSKINNVAKKIAKGEVDKRVTIDSDDEVGELAESFNYMADYMEKTDKNRREFISNVSHEIRSPITSIKGFIGGILDGIIPKEKEKYYLSITYKEIQRLTRLVNDLLDLSAMESGKMKFNITKVNINEIIRLAVIKFETKITEKKINVDVCFEEESTFVLADYDRITQVVTNLLDNAIKYAKESGNIKVNTKIKRNKVHISIYNDGPCIKEQDIKNIWDRFYKEDKARTSKVSTGLGLPIVRNILTHLGEDIWVENKKETGVCFTFTLKKA